MKCYRYPISLTTKLPVIAGILAFLLCGNTIYTLYTMPGYTHYWDYWCTLAASALLGIFCLLFHRRRQELLLLPTGILAIAACITPSLTHWMVVSLFFLFLLPVLCPLPKWACPLLRIAGIGCWLVGVWNVLFPMLTRIAQLYDAGRATASFVVPFLLRTVGNEPLCLTALLLLVFSRKPHIRPYWMDEHDSYDRIWE